MTNPCRLPLKPRWLAAGMEKLLGLDKLGRIYDQRPAKTTVPEFLQYTLDSIGVEVSVRQGANLEELPTSGPLLIVANHPLGGLEGVALARVLIDRRPDLQVLANQLLHNIPELAQLFIGVDVISGNAASANVKGIKQVHYHLENGGAVLIFPAGMVAAYEFSVGRIQDRSWNRLIGNLAKRYECTCLPVHVGGRNSGYFYAAGILHPRLRTVLLPRQLANKNGVSLPLTIGRPIPPQELRLLQKPASIRDYLRVSTDALADPESNRPGIRQRVGEALAPLGSGQAVGEAVASLDDCKLVEHEEFDVYCAPHNRLGVLMEEIAIAREISFRAVGEGTGQARDSDRFDPHYLHLVLWDKQNNRVAGAYRMGLVDEIVSKHGVKGLYSRSLYKYDRNFVDQLGAAIEMGRSFIHPDYQRRPVALNLLWRGIGRMLVENPRYHTLFGSVSISREYSDLARSLIADTLLTNYNAGDFLKLVRPLSPHRIGHRVWDADTLAELANIKILSKLIGRCDPGKALPVLLRHYLSLNGKLVCFNIHPNFNDSLEGLIIVDVRQTDPKTLRRFLGTEGYAQFVKQHQLEAIA